MGWLKELQNAWCNGTLGKPTKSDITLAVQAGIAEIAAESGPTPVTIEAEIQGYIPAGNDNGSQDSMYGYPTYNPAEFGVVPTIDSAEGHNPQCDGEGNSIGTLVIDPKLPAGSASAFDLTTTMVDNSGGGGGVFLFCPATGQYTGYQSSMSSSFGNNTGPVTQTHTLNASALSCPIEDVRIGVAAWGVSSDYEGDPRCDELSTEIGTLVTVTPSACAAAAQCFEQMFGCSISAMTSQPGSAVNELQTKVDTLSVPLLVYLQNPLAVRGFVANTYGPREGTQPGTKAGWEAQWGALQDNVLPSHTSGAAPDTVVVETDNRFAPSERGNDDHHLSYKIQNVSDKPLSIQDTDGRAESVVVFVGCGDCYVKSYERFQQNDAGQNQAPYSSDGAPVATIPPNSVAEMHVFIHDPGADFSGFNPLSLDDDVELISWSSDCGQVCKQVEYNLCEPYQLQGTESFKPLEGLECKVCTCCGGAAGEGEGAGDAQLSTDYEIDNFREAGFFFSNVTQQSTAMNAQLQVFNRATVPGPASWEVRFDSNYDIAVFTPSAGFTAGAIDQTDNGSTYSYIIPITGAIPGNNGNMQVAIEGERHPNSTDSAASHTNEGVYI